MGVGGPFSFPGEERRMTTIGLEDHGRLMTLEDFLSAEVVEGYRYELVRGVLFAEEIPDESHCQVVSNLYQILIIHGHHQPGVILRCGGGAEFLLCPPEGASALRPDVGVVLRKTPKDSAGRRNPALVVEVVSNRSIDRDHRIKRGDYLAFGLLEYWIIDFLERKMTLLTRDGDVWVERPCVEGRPIPSLVLPGLAASLADLWVDLDEYGPED
jgi:Uma2 family endonuclease